jgi:hypothetical protein
VATAHGGRFILSPREDFARLINALAKLRPFLQTAAKPYMAAGRPLWDKKNHEGFRGE